MAKLNKSEIAKELAELDAIAKTETDDYVGNTELITPEKKEYKPTGLIAPTKITEWLKYDFIADKNIMMTILLWATNTTKKRIDRINRKVGTTRYNIIMAAMYRVLIQINKNPRDFTSKAWYKYKGLFTLELRKGLGLPQNYKRCKLIELIRILIEKHPKDFVSVYPPKKVKPQPKKAKKKPNRMPRPRARIATDAPTAVNQLINATLQPKLATIADDEIKLKNTSTNKTVTVEIKRKKKLINQPKIEIIE